uniref:VPS37D subunit of ESCRT-I n=1 Tax=Amphiprion percula TaxID=161767 RepID=A0A3P8SV07_AMPPE
MYSPENRLTSSTCPDGYRALSTGELRELLQNDDKMDQIIRLNEKFQELQVDRETLLTTNRSVAEESLARRPRLNNGKLQLAEKYRELSNLATTCWEKQRVCLNDSLQSDPPLCVILPADAGLFVCPASQELLEKFMEGNVSLDEFLDSFQSSRKTYHIRRAQAEKMQELAQAKKQLGKTKRSEESKVPEVKKDSELPQEPQRVIGQLSGGWPANGRPVRVQQLYRPNPQQPEPPYR